MTCMLRRVSGTDSGTILQTIQRIDYLVLTYSRFGHLSTKQVCDGRGG